MGAGPRRPPGPCGASAAVRGVFVVTRAGRVQPHARRGLGGRRPARGPSSSLALRRTREARSGPALPSVLQRGTGTLPPSDAGRRCRPASRGPGAQPARGSGSQGSKACPARTSCLSQVPRIISDAPPGSLDPGAFQPLRGAAGTAAPRPAPCLCGASRPSPRQRVTG